MLHVHLYVQVYKLHIHYSSWNSMNITRFKKALTKKERNRAGIIAGNIIIHNTIFALHFVFHMEDVGTGLWLSLPCSSPFWHGTC